MDTWALIKDFDCARGIPWIVMGDFNEILFEPEKRGGNACDMISMQGFRDVIEECGLRDLGCSGYKYEHKINMNIKSDFESTRNTRLKIDPMIRINSSSY